MGQKLVSPETICRLAKARSCSGVSSAPRFFALCPDRSDAFPAFGVRQREYLLIGLAATGEEARARRIIGVAHGGQAQAYAGDSVSPRKVFSSSFKDLFRQRIGVGRLLWVFFVDGEVVKLEGFDAEVESEGVN